MQKTLLTATLAALAVASAASGAVISGWSFEGATIGGASATFGPIASDSGVVSGAATGVHASAASTWSSPAGNGSTKSFSVNTWAVGDYFQFTTATTGYQNINIAWDETGSGTGPRDFDLAISSDGGATFSSVFSYQVLLNGAPNTAWSSGGSVQAAYHYSVNVSASMNNLANAIFRLRNTSATSIGGGTVASGGTDRVDNVVINGDLLPTPGSASLIGLGALAALRRRR